MVQAGCFSLQQEKDTQEACGSWLWDDDGAVGAGYISSLF